MVHFAARCLLALMATTPTFSSLEAQNLELPASVDQLFRQMKRHAGIGRPLPYFDIRQTEALPRFTYPSCSEQSGAWVESAIRDQARTLLSPQELRSPTIQQGLQDLTRLIDLGARFTVCEENSFAGPIQVTHFYYSKPSLTIKMTLP